MENVFQKLGISDPHTLQEIRSSIDVDANEETGLIPLLKEHHSFLMDSIKIIMDSKSSIPEKRNHLTRFFDLLEMHAKAEQETLYSHLQQNTEEVARLEGLTGQDEHDIAFQLRDELNTMNYKTQWNDEIAAKAKVAATLVKNHMKEEEQTMFSVAKNNLSDEEIEQIRLEYISKCRSYLLH